ncbi:MAG: B12-binding domain-containing radical SAM protein [Chloroflexota bacterium]
MRVSLIHPPSSYTVSSLPPLGMAYVAAAIQQRGHKVRVFDWATEPELSLKNQVARIWQSDPEVIGLIALTGSYSAVQQIVAMIREKTACPIVLGGIHATLSPSLTLLENPGVDFVIAGESAGAFGELLLALEQPERRVDDIPGLAFRRGQEIVENGGSCPGIDPDRSFPAFHLFDLAAYDGDGLNGARMLPLLTGWDETTGSRLWRRRQVDSIIAELWYNASHYRSHAAWFVGQPFHDNDLWAQQLTQAITDRGLKIQWRCQADVANVTPRFLGQMRHAGCRQVDYHFCFDKGPLDEKYLQRLRRNVAWTTRLDIKSRGHLRIGLPGENEDRIKRLNAFMADLDLDEVEIQPYRPLVDSAGWLLAQERYLNTDQIGSIFRSLYENVPAECMYLSRPSSSSVAENTLKEMVREGHWLVSEARRCRKYELYFGKSLGTFLWRLSQQGHFRSMGRRIIDLGMFQGLRTAGEKGIEGPVRKTIQNAGEKAEAVPSTGDKWEVSAPAD